jgi:glucans biosynthesis protein
LRNPLIQEVHNVAVTDVRGFGLMQRDRRFEHYQDIELAYEERPSYWIEPIGKWGEGRIELIELATRDETFDNIIVAFVPNKTIEAGKPFNFACTASAAPSTPSPPPPLRWDRRKPSAPTRAAS